MPYASPMFVFEIIFNEENVFSWCSFNKEPICWLSSISSIQDHTTRFSVVQEGAVGCGFRPAGPLALWGTPAPSHRRPAGSLC